MPENTETAENGYLKGGSHTATALYRNSLNMLGCIHQHTPDTLMPPIKHWSLQL